jgi:hypothetical protein
MFPGCQYITGTGAWGLGLWPTGTRPWANCVRQGGNGWGKRSFQKILSNDEECDCHLGGDSHEGRLFTNGG